MRIRLLAAAALAVGGLSTAGTSHAACFGTSNTVVVCVNPPTVDPTGNTIDDCVHVGLPDCVPVSVPVPTVTPNGEPISCGGRYGAYLNCSVSRR